MADHTLDLAQLSRDFAAIARARDWSHLHTPRNLAAAITVEAGELLEIFQWDNRDVGAVRADADTVERSADELADILMYLNALADALGIDLAAAVARKASANRARFLDD